MWSETASGTFSTPACAACDADRILGPSAAMRGRRHIHKSAEYFCAQSLTIGIENVLALYVWIA